jgi:uncharacterized membrane protein
MLKLIRELAPPSARERQADPRRIARAVFWSFFGVRRMRDLESDRASITPLQAIAAGMIGTLILVTALFTLVRIVTA